MLSDVLRRRQVSSILCILWLVVITLLSLTPSPPQLSNAVFGWDKLQHASAYAVLTLLAIRGFSTTRSSVVAVFLGVVTFGVLMELAQGFLTHNRFADVQDSLANMLGALVVSLFYFIREKRTVSHSSCKGTIALLLIAATLALPCESRGYDTVFNSAAEFSNAAARLKDEAGEVARFPVDTENYGLLATLAVAGTVAATAYYDEDIRDEVASWSGDGLDLTTDAGSLLGNPFLHLGVAAGVYGVGILGESPKIRELGEMFGEAAILADAVTLILKQSIGRGRPSTTSDSGRYQPFQFRLDYDSLPSMHTASSFAMASVMSNTTESPLTGLAAYTAAAFVGLSRIYQNKHWASDVLLGAAIGELCGRVVTRYHAEPESNKVTITPMLSSSSAVISLVGRF